MTCWGKNNLGQLGTGGTSDSNVPVANPTLTTGVTSIAAGYNHTCAIASGELWCWGDNFYGQLGVGTSRNVRLSPVHVSLPDEALAVASGEGHTCALTGGGAVMCWGDNGYGQLGDSTFDEHLTPFPVTGLGSAVAAISSHGNHNCALTTAGGLLCWGDNFRGMLGDGSSNNVRNEPVQVVGLASGVAEIAAGYYHSCALTTSGVVKCWGYNFYGELGDGTNTSSNVPVDVSGTFNPLPELSVDDVTMLEGDEEGVTQAVFTVSLPGPSGKTVTVAYATADGTATAPADYMPAAGDVTFAPGETAQVIRIDVVGDVLDEPDETFTVNLSGAVNASILDATGTGTITDNDLAVVRVAIDAGFNHSCAITAAGAAKCWGYNSAGELGDGTTDEHLTAVAVSGLSSGVAAIAVGESHTCGLSDAGGVTCWGRNGVGELGDGSTITHSTTPVSVSGLSSGVAAISAGGSHTCALTMGGAVKCWGYNVYGELGDGTTDSSSTPVAVVGLSGGVVAISNGTLHTCALTSAGGVLCWGLNNAGQLGDGTTTERHAPVGVSGLSSGVRAIAAGGGHTCALMESGVVKCWGMNGDGQLGDGTTGPSSIPVNVLGLSGGVEAIAAGTFHSCVLISGGAAQCWGFNVGGQLGDGTTLPRSGPVSVLGLSDAVAISVGYLHSCALTSSGDPVCWGYNASGQLGDGTKTERHAPVEVVGFRSKLSINDVAVIEGNSGTTPATFTITLSGPSAQTVTVAWATQGIEAFADGDYLGTFGIATFAPGDTTEPVTIDVVGDSDLEGDERFSVILGPATNASILDETGIATIVDDDASTISIGDVSLAEGNSGTSPATFTVSLSEPSVSTITVGYSTLDESALSGSDYVAATGTLTFLPGDVEESITIDVKGDMTIEPDETFHVVLSNPVGASIADFAGQGTIVNDDVPSISITDASATEGNAGSTQAALTVSLSAPTAATVTVHYATSNSSATAPADYTAASGTLTFTPGETAKEIRVDVIGDTLDEANETFAVDLSNPTNATIADTFAIVTITDDDAPPALSVNDVAITEGDTGTAPLAFTISLSAPSGKTVTVNVATVNGTAVAGTDYTATSGVVTIAPGATSAPVNVPIRGDVVDETNETFSLALSSPANATIADGTGVGTIVDDDPKPVITSFNPGSLPQGDTVTIRGSGFTGATAVTFARVGGGTVPAASFRVVNDTRVTAVVPPGATTGRVSMTTPNGTGTSTVDLLIEPRITAFSPASGPVGTLVTITGSGFTGATSVRFGMTPATSFTVVSDTQLTVTVPVGARTSKIQVVTPGGSATSMGKFTVP